MEFSKKVKALYIEQLKSAHKITDEYYHGATHTTKDIQQFAHKILGTAGLFGDNKLSKICQYIDSSQSFETQTNQADRQFLIQFHRELNRKILKTETGEEKGVKTS